MAEHASCRARYAAWERTSAIHTGLPGLAPKGWMGEKCAGALPNAPASERRGFQLVLRSSQYLSNADNVFSKACLRHFLMFSVSASAFFFLISIMSFPKSLKCSS